MKKKLLLLIPALFLIASCNETNENDAPPDPEPQPHVDPEPPGPDPDPKKPCPDGTCVDDDLDGKCDVCGFPYEHQHAKSVGGDPSGNFILKVGEEREIKAELSPTPDRPVEKTFTWKTSDSSVATVTANTSNTAKAVVKGIKEGNVRFTATNDYSPATLFRNFNARVINFDEDNMNLWQYSGDDKAQFGYTSDNRAGVASGTAILNGLSWDFTRSEAISLNLNNGGMIGFGKGSEPETSVKLVNHNIRKVKKIEVETCSANGLANLTVKVGDNEVINSPTPSSSDDSFVPITSGELESLEGDISIEFTTPEYDPSRIEDETYKKPGCVYLKSILISYEPEEIEYVTEKTYDFEAMYADTDSSFYKMLTSSAAAKVYEDDDFVISFANVGKSTATEYLKGYAKTNKDIEILSKKTGEVIKSVKFEYKSQESSKNSYDIYSSILGGAPYTSKRAIGDNSNVSAKISDPNVNAINLFANKSAYVGLKSLTIKTVAGEHAVIDSIAFDEGAVPTKTEYIDGDLFDPTGLGNATVKFTNTLINDVQIPADAFIYYDGTSYDEPADHSGKNTVLSAGTTYVYAVYQNFEIKIQGLTVELLLLNFTKVKDVSEISNDGSYLLASPSNKAFVLGSSGDDIDSGKGCCILSDVIFGDDLQISKAYENDLFTISESDGTFIFATTTNHTYAFTKDKYNASNSMSAAYKNWEITIDNDTGVATILMALPNDITYQMAFKSNIIKPYATTTTGTSLDIALYKLAD